MSEHSQILTLPNDQYRAASGISNSDLKWIAAPKTPAHFKAFRDGLIKRKETDAMRIGSVTHAAILEPDTLSNAFAVRPDGMTFTTKEGKAWRDAQTAPIIDSSDLSKITSMRDAVWNHPKAKRLLSGAKFEQSLFVQCDGVLLKARLDALTSGNIIPDVKTCEDASLDAFSKSIADYQYERQAYFYTKVCNLLGLDKTKFVFIAVEKNPPFAVACWSLDDLSMSWGERQIERDLTLYRTCMETGKWPGYAEEINEIGLPEWTQKQLEKIL